VLVAALVVGLVAAGVTLVRSTRVAAARAASAQLSRDLVAASACAIVEIGSDRLEAIARQKHPEALVPERRSESVVIGLVFDTNCTLVAHRVGRRSGDDEFDETAWLGQTLGERYSAPFLASGISEVAAGGRSGPGTPWIVWGVLPSTH